MTRDELIAALESADRGSHELDAKVIAHLISGTAEYSERAGIWYVCRGVDRHGDPRSWEPKLGWESALWRTLADRRGPTRSLDAALLLVPDGMYWQLTNSVREVSDGTIEPFIHTYVYNKTKLHYGIGNTNTTMPLAACIAALRARKEIADG